MNYGLSAEQVNTIIHLAEELDNVSSDQQALNADREMITTLSEIPAAWEIFIQLLNQQGIKTIKNPETLLDLMKSTKQYIDSIVGKAILGAVEDLVRNLTSPRIAE